MSWIGYYTYAGTEIINAPRVEAYAEDAGLTWFKPVVKNDYLGPMTGDVYGNPLQDDAPWTDPDDPSSYDFLGFYPIDITGIEDSTTTATVTESTLDGGNVGKTRRATRAVVFNGLIIATSECGAEYGMRWLRAALNGGPCAGRSDESCGGSELCYLSCEPIMDLTPTILTATESILSAGNFTAGPPIGGSTGPAMTVLTNVLRNPIADGVAATTGWTGSRVTLSVGTGYIRGTITDNAAGVLFQRFNAQTLVSTVTPGQTVRMNAQGRTSSGSPIMSSVSFTDGAGVTVQAAITSATVAATGTPWVDVPELTLVVPVGAVYALAIVGLGAGTRAISDTVDFRHTSLVASTVPVTYFDGDYPDTSFADFAWAGAVNLSFSTKTQTRNIYNLLKNPMAESVDTTAPWTFTRMTGSLQDGYLRGRITDTTAGSLAQRFGLPTSPTSNFAPVRMGDVVRLTGQGRTSSTSPMVLGFATFRDSAGVSITGTSATGTPIVATGDEWVDLPELVVTAPSDAYFANPQFGLSTGTRNIGDTVDFRNMMITVSSQHVGQFDGDDPDNGLRQYEWTGDPHESTTLSTPLECNTLYTPSVSPGILYGPIQTAHNGRTVSTWKVSSTGATATTVTPLLTDETGNIVMTGTPLTIPAGSSYTPYTVSIESDPSVGYPLGWRAALQVTDPLLVAVQACLTVQKYTEVSLDPELAEECLTDSLRTLRAVTVVSGPSIQRKMPITDGSAVWSVGWTAVAANPIEFGAVKPYVEGFMDPAVMIPFPDGVVPDGASWDSDGFIQDEPDCPISVYTPVFDPICPLVIAPPGVPVVELSCFDMPVNYVRRQFTIPKQEIPLWGDVVPRLSISTLDFEVRSLRLRFYADVTGSGDPNLDPCAFCGDIVFSYIPVNSTLIFDGADHSIYVESASLGKRRADSLVFKSDGTPFDWPELSCGFGYIVTIDMPQTQTPPVIDMSLISRVS